MLTYPKIGSTILNKSKIKLFAVILNYRQDGSPSFRTQNAALSLLFYVPNKWAKKKIPQITYIYRTYARTFEPEQEKRQGSWST